MSHTAFPGWVAGVGLEFFFLFSFFCLCLPNRKLAEDFKKWREGMWWMRLLLYLLLSAPIARGTDLRADGQPQAGEFVKEDAGSQEKANHVRPFRHPEDSLVTFSWPVPMPDRNYIHCGILVKDRTLLILGVLCQGSLHSPYSICSLYSLSLRGWSRVRSTICRREWRDWDILIPSSQIRAILLLQTEMFS
jgi:hypothetical protein